MPIEKAHFTVTKGQSQSGTDALILKVNEGVITEVCFVESKLRTGANNVAGVEGARQLAADYAKDIPDMLTFTAARLYDNGDSLYNTFMQYMGSRADQQDLDSFRLLLFYDRAFWSERCLANLEDDEPTLSPLTAQAIRVEELGSLITELFGRLGVTVVEDEP